MMAPVPACRCARIGVWTRRGVATAGFPAHMEAGDDGPVRESGFRRE